MEAYGLQKANKMATDSTTKKKHSGHASLTAEGPRASSVLK